MDLNTPSKKKRVGFTPAVPSDRDHRPTTISVTPRLTLSPPNLSPIGVSPTESVFSTGNHSRNGSSDALIPDPGRAHLPQVSAEVTDQIRAAFTGLQPTLPINAQPPTRPYTVQPPARPRPALRRGDSTSSLTPDSLDFKTVQDVRAKEAHERGKRLERNERVKSAPVSRRPSPSGKRSTLTPDEIPLEDLGVHSDAEGKPADFFYPVDLLQLGSAVAMRRREYEMLTIQCRRRWLPSYQA